MGPKGHSEVALHAQLEPEGEALQQTQEILSACWLCQSSAFFFLALYGFLSFTVDITDRVEAMSAQNFPFLSYMGEYMCVHLC